MCWFCHRREQQKEQEEEDGMENTTGQSDLPQEPDRAGLTRSEVSSIWRHRRSQGLMGCLDVEVCTRL